MDPENGRPTSTPNQILRSTGHGIYNVSATKDGRTLSLLKDNVYMNVQVGQLVQNGAHLEDVRRLTSQHSMEFASTWTPDSSSVLYASTRNAASNIFKQNLHTQTVEKLFGSTDMDAGSAQFTPDRSYILYLIAPKGPPETTNATVRLMRAPVAGGSAEIVMEEANSLDPGIGCPRNSKALCILSEKKQNELTLYELDPLRGKAKLLASAKLGSRRFYGWDVSPDGSEIAVVSSIGPYIHTIDLSTSRTRDIQVPREWYPQSVGWAADGKAVFVTIWTPNGFLLGRVDLAGQSHVLLNKGQEQWMIGPVASPDGRYLAFSVQTWDSNVWLLENFQAVDVD